MKEITIFEKKNNLSMLDKERDFREPKRNLRGERTQNPTKKGAIFAWGGFPPSRLSCELP